MYDENRIRRSRGNAFLFRFQSRPEDGYLTKGVPAGQSFDGSAVKGAACSNIVLCWSLAIFTKFYSGAN